MKTDQIRDAQGEIGRGLIIGGVFLTAVKMLSALSPEYLDAELARRLQGAVAGMVSFIYANAVPKSPLPLSRGACDPKADQARRRFVGWCLTLGSLGYMMAWLFAPIESAGGLAMCFLGTSLLTAMAGVIGIIRLDSQR
mgnify:CR=1 FL=1